MSYKTLWLRNQKPFVNHLQITIQWREFINWAWENKERTMRWCEAVYPLEIDPDFKVVHCLPEFIGAEEHQKCDICVELKRRHANKESRKKLGL